MISESYRDLNVALHASNASYGVNGRRWADVVRVYADERKCETILDYGCGKGSLRKALQPRGCAEYDPAVAGKDARPEPADLVVCADVLEHIEPEHLDAVLDDIRTLANKAVFLVIATRPAKKVLADGRNAHLIVEPPEWWRAKVDRYFRISEWMAASGEIVATGLPYKEVDTTKIKAAQGDAVRTANIAANVKKVKHRLVPTGPHDETAIILCYGPSLASTWDAVATSKAKGGKVVSVSGAHDFAVGRGIIPNFHVDSDPRAHKVKHITKPQAETRYLLASCVHPSLVDHLAGYDVNLWHALDGEWCFALPHDLIGPDEWFIDGGASVGLRSLNLFYSLGYRRFEIHGMDCSFSDDGEQHAGAHAGKPQHVSTVRVGGRDFKTSTVLAHYAKGFFEHTGRFTDAEWFLYGDGMLQHWAFTMQLMGVKAA